MIVSFLTRHDTDQVGSDNNLSTLLNSSNGNFLLFLIQIFTYSV